MISPRQYRGLSKWIRPQIVAHPTIEPVSRDDFRKYKRLRVSEDLSVVDDKLLSARVDAENHMGFGFVYQVWDAFMELPPGTFPYFGMTSSIFARYFGYQPEGIEIPRPPLISVMGVYITDESGTETLVDPSIYWVSRQTIPGRIAQRIDASWPDTAGRAFETFRIRFSCGYLIPFQATASQADLSAPGHNYNVGDILQLTNRGGDLPANFAERTNYYVVASNQTAGTLQLSKTSNGSAIIPADSGTEYQFLGVLPDNIRRAILEMASEDRFGSEKKATRSDAGLHAMPERAREYLDREGLGPKL